MNLNLNLNLNLNGLFHQQNFQAMTSYIMEEIREEGDAKERKRLMGVLRQCQASAAGIGIKDLGIDEDDESLLKTIHSKTTSNSGQFVHIPSYLDPNGVFRRRGLMSKYGSSRNVRYVQNNIGKFEAYEEMERRVMRLYNEISIEGYKSISELLRVLD